MNPTNEIEDFYQPLKRPPSYTFLDNVLAALIAALVVGAMFMAAINLFS